MMATVRLKYIHSFVDHTGTARFYFRYKGARTPLPDSPGSEDFNARYAALLAAIKPEKVDDRIAFAPATLGYVIEKYLANEKFTGRAANTKRRYRQYLDWIRQEYGRGLMIDLQEDHISAMRAAQTHTSAKDSVKLMVSMMWAFAKEDLNMKLGPNPTADLKNAHKKRFSHAKWPQHVIEGFEKSAKPNANMRRALYLLLYTGQRIGDVAAMKWTKYDGKGILVRQEKTGKSELDELYVPCHPILKAELDRTPRTSEYILTTFMGDRYTTKSLSNAISDGVRSIGETGYSAHGLRANAAIALAEADCTEKQIMAITGHRTVKQVHEYMRGTEQKKLAQQAMKKLVAKHRTNRARKTG